jgi:hypothetical protein
MTDYQSQATLADESARYQSEVNELAVILIRTGQDCPETAESSARELLLFKRQIINIPELRAVLGLSVTQLLKGKFVGPVSSQCSGGSS